MKIYYTSDGIDIVQVECMSNETDDLIKALKKNYPCVEKTKISIVDKNETFYLYYFGLNGKRAISDINFIYIGEITAFVCKHGHQWETMLKKLKLKISNL